MKKQNFNGMRVIMPIIQIPYENKEAFKGWFCTTWLPYLHRMPIEVRENFIDIVTETYLQINSLDQEGKIHTGMQRLEFVALK